MKFVWDVVESLHKTVPLILLAIIVMVIVKQCHPPGGG